MSTLVCWCGTCSLSGERVGRDEQTSKVRRISRCSAVVLAGS